MDIFSVIPQRLDVLASPTFLGLTTSTLTLDLAQDYKFLGHVSSLAIQSQTANSDFGVNFFTKQGDLGDSLSLRLFSLGLPGDITNSEFISLSFFSAGVGGPKFVLFSGKTGTGTVRSLSFYTGTNTTQLVLNTDNSIDMSGALTVAGSLVAGATTVDSLTFDFSGQNFLITHRSNAILAIQGQSTGQTTEMELYAFDGDATDNVVFRIFARGTPSDISDNEVLNIGYFQATSSFLLFSSATVGETLYPIEMGTGNNLDQFVLGTDGNNTMSGALTVTDTVTCSGLVHIGDTNTRIVFGTDFYFLEAGGFEMARFTGIGKQKSSVFNDDKNDIDFFVKTVNEDQFFYIDAALDNVRIGDRDTNYTQIDVTGNITQVGTGRYLESAKYKLTAIGGYAVKLTNKTGSNTIAGQLVITSTGTDDAFATAGASSDGVIGIVLDGGIADGSEAWVVEGGVADTLIDAGGCTHGDRMISSATAGSADVWNTGGAVATHFQEIGHCLETRVGAGLARVKLHFN